MRSGLFLCSSATFSDIAVVETGFNADLKDGAAF
jgi:hypothetical protein